MSSAKRATRKKRLRKTKAQRAGETRSLERAPRESDDGFEAVFNQAAVGMVLTDLNGRFLRPNLKLGDILDYEEDDLADLRFSSIIHPDDIDPFYDLLARVLAEEKSVDEHEIRLLLKDGSITWGFVTVSLV